ncbi:MAG: SRPBCC domain-containing protein [Chloroflexi bacterium]|nr:SRPBCC domain-containing protein [Chloroflexota bacterium]
MLLRVRIAAPLQRVWQALSSPDQLEVWLAEHAEVDLPRTFAFWGRYTPDGEVAHQRLMSADDHTLRFIWTLGGEDTTVEIHVESDGAEASVVSVSQTHYDFQQALAESSSLSVIQTFWALSLGNLVDFLAGRGVAYRCDFTTSNLRAELEINAPRERIYTALVDSDQISTWFDFPIGIEPWVGGRFAMGGLQEPLSDQIGDAARIVALEPGRTMSVNFGDAGVATWELAGSQGRTRLTFVQSGFSTPRPPYAAWLGTVAGLLSLRRYAEDPNWKSIYVAVSGVM